MTVSNDAALNPWKSMWTRPGHTVGHLVQHQPGHRVLLIAALAGVSGTFLGQWPRILSDSVSLPLVMLNAVLLGSLWGIALLYLQGMLVVWTGTWLNGRGNGRGIRTALAWGSLPVVAGEILLLLVASIMSRNAHSASPWAGPGRGGWPDPGLMLVFAALGVWSLALTAIGVGRVQGFSAWKALANVMLAGAVLFASLAVLLMAV